MEYDYDVYLLSQKFFDDYPLDKYPELMYKAGRPYNCLLIDANEFFICIPYRSSINHKNSFMFKETKRSLRTRSGLDYSKLVLIKDDKYLDDKKAIVDKDEYNETVKHMPRITREINQYIETYVLHVTGAKVIHPREYERKYQYSTLPYFRDILGI
jgi:protein AbiQ